MTEPRRETREIASTGEWLAWREKDVTASRLPCLFDAHPYMSRADLAAIMRGFTGSGSPAIPADSPAMRAGRILEPAVAAAAAEDHPEWTIVKATTYHRLPECRLGCTPDYWINDDGLVQIKTVSPQVWEKWHGKPPLAYTLQTLTELLVTGRAWGVLAVMIRNPSYPVYYWDIPRHEAAERRILDAVAQWWHAWETGAIPEAVPSDALAAELDDGSYRDFSDDNELPLLLEERHALKATTSIAEKRLKEIDYIVKNRMGPASTAWLPGWQLSFKAQERKEFTVPAATIRVLRVKATADQEDDHAAN
jgi:predicted phage-related endonuclease